jgi:hypothetical protein
VAYYPFNGNANDESGNDNHGTVHGAILCEDRYGNSDKAYCFDGVDDYVNIPDSPELSGGTGKSFTWSVWVNATSIPSPGSSSIKILSKVKDFCFKDWVLGLWGDFPDLLIWNYENGCGNQGPLLSSNQTVDTSKWYHYLIAYDGEDRSVKMYINGKFENSSISNYHLPDTDAPVKIGISEYELNGSWGPFHGKIDDIRIYNRALTETEIQQLFNQPVAAGSLIGVDWGENDEILVRRINPVTGEMTQFALIQPPAETEDWWTPATLDSIGRYYYILANFNSSTQTNSSSLYVFDLDDPDPNKEPLRVLPNIEYASDGLSFDPKKNALLTTYPSYSANDQIRVVSINPVTGQQSPFASIPLLTGYDEGYAQTALNAAGRHYYLLANFWDQTLPNTASLYTFNLDSGSLIQVLHNLEYGSYDLTYAFAKDKLLSPNFEREDITVLQVDPNSGVHTVFATITPPPNLEDDASASTAIDNAGRRYYCLAEFELLDDIVWDLYVYDLDTGALLHKQNLNYGPGDLVFDSGVAPCECNLNYDGACNILDWPYFIEDWGRTNCGTPPGSGSPPNDCECDLNHDGSCNILDWPYFIEDWGRSDCPVP